MSAIRPMNDWVLVQMDPLPTQKGSVIVLEDSTTNTVRTGTVLEAGHGRKTDAGHWRRTDVEKGEKVAFFRWHLEHKTGKQVTSQLRDLGDDLGLIKAADILFAYPASEQVEIG